MPAMPASAATAGIKNRREIIMAAKRPDLPALCAWQESNLRKVPAIRWWRLTHRPWALSQVDSQTGLGATDG